MKTLSLLKPLSAMACALPLLVRPAQALVVTPADGGIGISADTAANAAAPGWTTLGPITLAEQGDNRGDIGAGTLVLQAPAGFAFNTAVTPSISFVNGRNITAAAIAVTASNVLTITLSVNGSNALDTLTIGNPVAIQVRPVAGAGLASGSLHRPVAGGSAVLIDVMPGPGGTSFGGLSTKAGRAHHLAVQTAPTAGVAGVIFAPQPVVQVRDQFGNVLSAVNGNADNASVISATLGSGAGLLQGTKAASAANGIASFTNLASTNAGRLTLSFNSPGLVGAAVSNLVVSPGPAAGLGFATQPGSVSYGLPLNPQPAVRTVDAFGNFSTVGLPASRVVTLTLTTGTGTLLGTTALDIGTTAGNGVVSYFGLGVSAVGPGKQLTASADGLASGVSGLFEIAPLRVNGAVTVSHRAYDGTTNATILTRSLSGVLPGQTAVLTGGTASFVNKNAGTGKTVVVTGLSLTGTHAENYQLSTNAIYTTANISQAPLTVNANNQVRTYGATNAPLTITYMGLVGGETEASSGITGTPALATTAGTNSPPGIYPITLSAGTLTSQNYSFTSFNPGTVTVTKGPLIVAADNKWKVAGAVNPPLTYSFLGLMNGESPAVILGAPGLSTTAAAGSPLGAYPITVTLGTLTSGNYAFTLANGTLSVTPAGTLWHDEFTRPTEPGKMTPWIVQSGAWKITEGTLEGGTNALNTYGIVRITNTWTDYAVQARVRLSTNSYGGGVGGRLQEANGTRYVAWLYPENSSGGSNVLKLLKFHTWNAFGYSNVSARAMQHVAVPPVGTNWHTLRLAFQGNRIGILLDGVRLINVVDTELPSYTSGAVTLEQWTETNSYTMHFDDVRVSVPAGPVALNDSYTVATTSVLKVPASGVLANDVADALELTAQLVSGPAHGTVTLTNNGGFTYTPATPYTGPDSFTYRASDGSGGSAEATVHITVINNSAPAATPDAYTAMSGVPLIVNAPGVLANDSDPDGQVLTASLLAGPTNGTLTLSANGSFTYTPAIGYTGPDAFTYRANDGMANSGVATVSLTVTPAGVLFTDSFARETDPGTFAPWIPQAGNWLISGGHLRGGFNNPISYGQVYLNTNWTDYSVEATVQFSAGAYGGGIGGRLNPVTGARYSAWIYPQPGGGGLVKVLKFQSWGIFAYHNVVGAVAGQATVASVGLTPHKLKLVFQGDRIGVHYDGQRVLSVADTEAAGYVSGGITTEFWTEAGPYYVTWDDVMVNPPTVPFATNDVFTVVAGSTLTVPAPGVLTNDTAGAGLLSALLGAGPASGSLNLSANGGFTYTPTITSGSVNFTYRVSDGAATSSLATVTINVTPNTPPVASGDAYNAISGVPLIVSAPGVLGNDSDLNGQALSAVPGTTTAHGTLSLSADGSFTYTAFNNYVGPDSFTYRASDGTGFSGFATVSITVGSSGQLFSENFTRGSEPGPLSPWIAQSGVWSVTQGVLQAGNNAPSSYGYAYVPTNWVDYAVEARIRFPAGGFGGGIGARLNPATGSHYGAWIYPETTTGGPGALKLVKFQNWNTFSYTNLASTPMRQVAVPSVGTNWHTLKLIVQGNLMTVIYDGVQYISMPDAEAQPYSAGGFSADLWTAGLGYTLLIDDVAVTLPPSTETRPSIAGMVNNANGTVTVHFQGGPLTQYIVQTATNLVPPVVWSNVATNTSAANGAWSITDSRTGRPQRFYRAAK